MDKIKSFVSGVVQKYNALSPNWQRAVQVTAAIIGGYIAGKVL